jgi:hypothetical protein
MCLKSAYFDLGKRGYSALRAIPRLQRMERGQKQAALDYLRRLCNVDAKLEPAKYLCSGFSRVPDVY